MRFLLQCAILIVVAAVPVTARQNSGALKGTVTDQLESLVVEATVTVRYAYGVVTIAKTIHAGVYEL